MWAATRRTVLWSLQSHNSLTGVYLAKLSIAFGVALILVGIGGFLPNHAPTALIPAYVGIVLAIFGVAAMKPTLRMHAMHFAVLLALIGCFAAGGRLAISLSKTPIDNVAVTSQSLMTVLCGVFVFLCVRSFIAARRARRLSA
jgi:uncharacterized membrane protein HdeD (DUF308 family)